jgi:hypothetical protein
MKNLKKFNEYVLESFLFDRSTLIESIQEYLIPSLDESQMIFTLQGKPVKKKIDEEKMAEEMAKIISGGKTATIRNLRGEKTIYPITDKLAQYFLDVLDTVISSYYKRGFFDYITKEEVEDLKMQGLESILGDWHKTDLTRTPKEIFGWIYALGNRGVSIAGSALTEKWKKKKEYEQTAVRMERILKDIQDDIHSEGLDKKTQTGSGTFDNLSKIPLEVREEVFKCLNKIKGCTYDDVLNSIKNKDLKVKLNKSDFDDLKKVFNLTRA